MKEEFRKEFSNHKPVQDSLFCPGSCHSDPELKDLKRLIKTGLKYTSSRRYLLEQDDSKVLNLKDGTCPARPVNKSPSKVNCAINLAEALDQAGNYGRRDIPVKKIKSRDQTSENEVGNDLENF